MFVLLVELEAKTKSLQRLETVLKSMVELSEKEDGILYYSVNRPQERQNAIVLYELYKNRKAWEAHLQLPLIQEALSQFETLLAVPAKITFCETIFTTSLM